MSRRATRRDLAAARKRTKAKLLLGAGVAVAGVAFAFVMFGAADTLEGREPSDQGWAALSLIGIFGGLVIVGTGLTLFLRAGYLWITGEEPPADDETW